MLPSMASRRPAVVIADTEEWASFRWLAAALRAEGFATYRVTAPPGTRMQAISSQLYRVAYSRTEVSLRWAGGTARVDVSATRSVWEPNVCDVQAADRVGAALVADRRWHAHERLHRVASEELRLYDKLRQMRDAAAAGVAVPPTFEDPADVPGDRVVVKQRIGSGGDAVVIVTRAEVADWVDRWRGQGGGLLFQQALSGTVLNVGGFARDGTLVAAVAYRTEHSERDPEGPAVRIRTLRRPDLLAGVGRYVAALQYTGAICCDFIDTGDGTVLIDVNPRFFGSWAAAQVAGCPLLQAYVQYLRGQPNTVVNPDVGEQTVWTMPQPDGTVPRTIRNGLRTLQQFSAFCGPRVYPAGATSLVQAVLAARREAPQPAPG